MVRRCALILLAVLGLALMALPGIAEAAPPRPVPVTVLAAPVDPTAPAAPTVSPSGGSIEFNINGTNPDGSKPATSLVIVIGLTLLTVAPAALLLCTSFTKVFMVLGITRNALGLTSMPPNQVLAGLALFISLFIMSPVVSQVNEVGVQPYLAGDKTQSQAFSDGVQPLRDFMLKSTREDELALLIKVSGQPKPASSAPIRPSKLFTASV